MKTDDGWIERGQMDSIGVLGARRGKEKGGRRREVEVSSGSVVAAPWLGSDVRVHFHNDARVIPSFRLVLLSLLAVHRSPFIVHRPPSTVHRPPFTGSRRRRWCLTRRPVLPLAARLVHAASVIVFPLSLRAVCSQTAVYCDSYWFISPIIKKTDLSLRLDDMVLSLFCRWPNRSYVYCNFWRKIGSSMLRRTWNRTLRDRIYMYDMI